MFAMLWELFGVLKWCLCSRTYWNFFGLFIDSLLELVDPYFWWWIFVDDDVFSYSFELLLIVFDSFAVLRLPICAGSSEVID